MLCPPSCGRFVPTAEVATRFVPDQQTRMHLFRVVNPFVRAHNRVLQEGAG